MRRIRTGLLCAVLSLSGCDHHRRVDPAENAGAPVASNDSIYTGEPLAAAASAPQAHPGALPVGSPSPPATPAPESAPAASPPEAHPAPASDTASSAPASLPAASPVSPPDSGAPSDSSPPPVPVLQTNPDMTRLEMNPPTPMVAANPPPALDEGEAQKQVVVLETSLGRIVIELDDVAAPRTCGNFRKLVSDGFYDHTVFHRVIPRFIIQGGDPNSKSDERATYGRGDPGYTLPAEIGLSHLAGAVAMARLPDPVNPQRDSNGSQFFICVAPCPSLDGKYTVFGHVIQGMETATKIAGQPRDPRDDPVARIEMTARLETKKQALEGRPNGP